MAISAITSAYQARNEFIEYVHPSYPNSNYEVLVNRPYPAPHAFTYEQQEAGPSANYNDLTPFEQLPSAVPQRPKSQTLRYQREEVKDIIEDVLKLLIDQRLCEISNANNSPITKRSVNQHFATRAASTAETNTFSQQQLAFLKDLKPEDIKQLIKLLVPATPALAANRTLPVQQGLPHLVPPTFYVPTPVWHPAQLQVPVLPPSPYFQNHLVPFHPFENQQIISYEPFKPAEEIQFQIMKPYVESPVAPHIMLNRLPPLSSPFVYSIQISAPVPSNQASARPLTDVPNSQMVSKPVLPKPHMGVTSNPQASSNAEKVESIFSQSRLLLGEGTTTKRQVTSTEKSLVDLGTLPSNQMDDVSKISVENTDPSKLKGDAVKGTARSAAEESSELGVAQLTDNESLLEAFKAIRESLMKNKACRMTAPKRRAIHEPKGDFIRNQIYQNYLNRHAIPPANLPGRRHNPPAKILYHKYAPHTPFRSTSW